MSCVRVSSSAAHAQFCPNSVTTRCQQGVNRSAAGANGASLGAASYPYTRHSHPKTTGRLPSPDN